MFWSLADAEDYRLLDIVADPDLRDTLLTYAAEYAGHLKDSSRVAPVLVPLLNHESPLVREGVVYGLGKHMDAPAVRWLLTDQLRTEPSAGVREAIQEVLDDHPDLDLLRIIML